MSQPTLSSEWAQEFALDPDLIHLNHAAVAPWPKRTADAVRRFGEENVRCGSRNYGRWLETEASLRERLVRLVNARSSDEIALLKSTSEGLSFVARGLSWAPGDSVVITSQEFPSNRIVWESLQTAGVRVRVADISGPDPEAAIIAAMDDSTRLLSVSSVQYGSGLRLDLARLGRYCREHDVLFCVDAIQSVGALRTDVRADRIDFLVADGHKWMLGPEGVALFYCREELLGRLSLLEYGWHMVERAGDFDRADWEPAHSARRFECGSPNMLGVHALEASLSLIEDVGMDSIERAVLDNTAFLIDRIQARADRYELLSDTRPDRRSGILTIRPRSGSTETTFERLQQAGLLCALRGGGIRFSPHFHTPRKALTSALAILDEKD